MDSKFNDLQKKQLEKIFAKLFDLSSKDVSNPPLTEEGRQLCMEAQCNPTDMYIRNLEFFSESANCAEVAQIRYDHYRQKRYRILTKITQLMEDNAMRKRLETEQAEKDYLIRQERGMGDNNKSLTGQPSMTLSRFSVVQNQVGAKQKGFQNKKIAFYNSKKNLIRSRLSASSRIGGIGDSMTTKNANPPLAMTPGAAFFNARAGRNNTQGRTGVAGIQSKTFENFVLAKQRVEATAKARIEKLNHEAIKRVKYETLSKRAQKDHLFAEKAKREAEQEKAAAARRRKEGHLKELQQHSVEQYKEQTSHAFDRLKQKQEYEKLVSQKDYQTNLDKQFYQTSRMGGSVRVGQSPDDKSQMSRTAASGFWGKKGQGQYSSYLQGDYDPAVEEQLQNVQDKTVKGFERSVMQKEFKIKRVQEYRSQRVTDTEAIRADQENQRVDVWYKHINKMTSNVKRQKQRAKDDKALAQVRNEKMDEKNARIQQNFKQERINIQERNNQLKSKFQAADQKVELTNQQKKIFQMKHKEIEELKKQDNIEQLSCLKNNRFDKSCAIVEKHLALSIMNQEQKNNMNKYNDMYRSKMAKERMKMKEECSEPVYTHVAKQHMNINTFAPDLVKWTKRDLDKIMKDPKKQAD